MQRVACFDFKSPFEACRSSILVSEEGRIEAYSSRLFYNTVGSVAALGRLFLFLDDLPDDVIVQRHHVPKGQQYVELAFFSFQCRNLLL